jgi:hypothetical protein
MVTWETANVNPVYLNGEKVKYLSGANTYRLFASMKYTLTGHFGDYTFTDEQEVQVGPWYESTFGLVSYYPWRYKAFRISSLDGEVLYFWIPDPEILSWVFYFHKDGTTTFSNHPGVFEPWYLLDDNTIVRNRTAMKLEVSQHEMMVSYQTTYNGELVWFDMIHEHASDTPTDPV